MQTRLVTLLAIVLVGAAGVVPMAFAGDPAQAASVEYVSQADLLARLGAQGPGPGGAGCAHARRIRRGSCARRAQHLA